MAYSKSTATSPQATRWHFEAVLRPVIGLAVTTILSLAARGQNEAQLWADALVKTTDLLSKDDVHGERVFGFASAMTKHGCHVVKVEGTASAQWVRLDGVPGPHYKAIAGLQFSANGKTLAYVAAAESSQSVVVDGQAGPPFPEIEPQTLVLSPAGQRHAYVARVGAKRQMVVDGKPYESRYECWSAPAVFSPDGRRVAFLEADPANRLMRIVLDGKPRPACGGIGADSLVFSADSRHFGYSANIRTMWHRVIDDVVQPAFDRMGINFAFSPDGKRHAYTAWGDGSHILVENGKVRQISGSIDRGLVYSPDGQHFALAIARSANSVYMERDGAMGPEFVGLGGAPPHEAKGDIFSSYWPLRSGLYHGATSAGIVYSPNSKRLAYPARSGGGYSVMLDEKEHGPFDALSGGILFSPDSARFAFAGQRGGQHYLIVDGQPDSPYDQIGHFEFSPDSQHVVYHAVKSGTSVVVVDGVERARYKAVPAGPAIRQDGALELIGIQDGLQRIVVKKW